MDFQVKRLQILASAMNVPSFRLEQLSNSKTVMSSVRWMNRNLAIHNDQSEQRDEVLKIVKSLLKS
jgi:hypothetical protein